MLPLGGFVMSLHSVFMRFMLFISIIWASNVVSETIYVRLNPQPFSSPFYIFPPQKMARQLRSHSIGVLPMNLLDLI